MKALYWIRSAAVCVAMFSLSAGGITTHTMPHAELKYTGGFITTDGVLVFPGVTLADLEGCSYWGRIGGSHINIVKTALSNTVQAYPAGATGADIKRYDFDLVTQEGVHVKAVHVQLYNGEGGVYAKASTAWFREYKSVNSASVGRQDINYTVASATGDISWKNVELRDVATYHAEASYGICVIGVARPVTTTSTLAYSGLTVSAIVKNAKAKLFGRISGLYMGASSVGRAAVFTSPYIVAGTSENPTAIRCEAQFLDGTTVKSAAFELSDGEGGVYVKLVGGYYKDNSTQLGEPLLSPEGELLSDVLALKEDAVPSELLGEGYCLYNLEVSEEARVDADTYCVFDQNTYLTGTAQLLFPGVTLKELEDCAFYGIMDGGSVNSGGEIKENSYAHIVKRYPEDKSEDVKKLFLQMSLWDKTYTKNVIVELSDGAGGVFGRALKSSYVKADKTNVPLFGVLDDGSNVTNFVGVTSRDPVSDDNTSGYGIKKLGATRMVSKQRLAFPGLKVADIFRGEIRAKTAGASMNYSNQFNDYYVCNRVITSMDATTGAITGFREELQWANNGDQSIRCVELRFTDGEGGVNVESVRSCYAAAPYTVFGRRMIATDDSAHADGTTPYEVATTFWTAGYGACNLAVMLPDDASTGPATAIWNGGDPANTSSWICKAGDGTLLADTLPDKHTQILITAHVSMTANADLTPYASVMTTAKDLKVDTKGHKLYVKSLDPWHPTEITDSAGGGELHLVVPEKFMTYNNIFKLSGKLKLVKDGVGVYAAVKLNQTYSGGTEIKGGIAIPYGNGTSSLRNWSMGGNGITKPSGQVITVSEGGTLDLNGNNALGYTTVIFNGGTVKGATSLFNCVKRLTADSYLCVTDTFTMNNYALELNEHTLFIDIEYSKKLSLECSVTGPGALEITRGGWFKMAATDINMQNVDLRVKAALDIEKTISVRDYYSYYDGTANTLGTTAALQVYGTFTPASDYFTGATLMDGATIDLSARTGVWSTKSNSNSKNTIAFKDGATVKVNLGEREMEYDSSNLAKVISWTTKPSNVKFVATNPERYYFVQRSDGLYCSRSGMAIIIR
jgi:hypothetical protein